MTLKSKLTATTAMPHWQDTRFGAPGLMRGFSIPRGPDDDSGGGGNEDDDNEDNQDQNNGGQIDPAKYAALSTAHERLKKDDKRRKQELADLKARLDQLDKAKEDAEHDAANKTGDVEKVRKQLEDKHGKELLAANARADKAEAQVRKLVIQGNLSGALDAVRVKPDLKKAATAMFMVEGIEIEEDDDGELAPTKGGLALADAVKLWAESDEGKAFVLEGNSGGGANGGGKMSATNPWKAGQINRTKQDEIEVKNPSLAARLKAEAGVA